MQKGDEIEKYSGLSGIQSNSGELCLRSIPDFPELTNLTPENFVRRSLKEVGRSKCQTKETVTYIVGDALLEGKVHYVKKQMTIHSILRRNFLRQFLWIRLTRFPPLRFRNLSSESSNAYHFVSGVLHIIIQFLCLFFAPELTKSKSNDTPLIIKYIENVEEYKLGNKYASLRTSKDKHFTPKIFDIVTRKTANKQIPKYTRHQRDILFKSKMEGITNPDLGEVEYETIECPDTQYIIMEQIIGKSLDNVSPEIITKKIDEIYEIYNIFCDNGYVLGDLLDRNIILSDSGNIYFIDFDPNFITNNGSAIQLSKRYSKEKLLKKLLPKKESSKMREARERALKWAKNTYIGTLNHIHIRLFCQIIYATRFN